MWAFCGILGLVFASLRPASGASATHSPANEVEAPPLVTSAGGFWNVPTERRGVAHRIRSDFLIYYFDPRWKLAWGEFGGVPGFLPIGDAPLDLNAGKKVEIDGYFLPSEQRILWDRTRAEVLPRTFALSPRVVRQGLTNFAELSGRMVTVEGLVDAVIATDPFHRQIRFVADGVRGRGMLLVRRPDAALPDTLDRFVRLTGVYAETKDVNQRVTDFALWIDDPAGIEVLSSLADDPRFALAPTRIGDFRGRPRDVLVKVAGEVRSQAVGKGMTVWDDTGQVQVQSLQATSLKPGDRVEVVGYPGMEGLESWLRNALFRRIGGPEPGTAASGVLGTLRLAERVR
ncbi:MAG: OB-fold nucleic acid binding domain-containing protein, partial [Verrucomicrobiales bacterium]|nr:OB-fold nucleic acid binding domain-containing protein [Verrucomicrobiales bacterium]